MLIFTEKFCFFGISIGAFSGKTNTSGGCGGFIAKTRKSCNNKFYYSGGNYEQSNGI